MELPATDQSDRERGVGASARALVVVTALFGFALLTSALMVQGARAAFAVGSPGTVSSLLVSVASLQLLGFGFGAAVVLRTREQRPRAYLRLREVTDRVVFYGTAVGLGIMLVAVGATVLFNLLGSNPRNPPPAVRATPYFTCSCSHSRRSSPAATTSHRICTSR